MIIFRLCALSISLFSIGLVAQAGQSKTGQIIEKPVTIIVPFSPGGSTDFIAKILAIQLESQINRPVLVQHVPGAGGAIGASQVARLKKTQGDVLLFTNTLYINAAFGGLESSLVHQLIPLAGLPPVPSVLLVPGTMPEMSFKKFIAEMREEQNRQKAYGSAGMYSASHVLGESFQNKFNLNFIHIPYKGSGPVYLDLISSRLSYAFDILPSALVHIQSKNVRAVAVTSASRVSSLPHIPTFNELGYEDLVFFNWYGLYCPSDVDVEIRQSLSKIVFSVLQSDAVKREFKKIGVTQDSQNQQDFTQTHQKNMHEWKLRAEKFNFK